MNTQTKTKSRTEFEIEMQEWIKDLYSQFMESAEKRKEVFNTFDEAVENFRDKPKIKGYFEKLKKAFQSLEVAN